MLLLLDIQDILLLLLAFRSRLAKRYRQRIANLIQLLFICKGLGIMLGNLFLLCLILRLETLSLSMVGIKFNYLTRTMQADF